MQTEVKVSIIVPVYNVESYIKGCLYSVFNQTYNNIELLVVDDRGGDNSMDIVYECKEKSPFNIKIITHDKNMGLSAARNSGIREAAGDYIFFLDSDDTLPSDSIQNLMNKVEKFQDVDFVIGGIKTIGKQIDYPLLSNEYIEGNDRIFYDYIHLKWNVMACNKLYKKKFLIDNELYFLEGIYHEDLDFTFRLALCANKMACCYENTYNYLIRANSITTGKKLKNYSDMFEIIKRCFSLSSKRCYVDGLMDDLYRYFIALLYSLTLYLITDNNKDIKHSDRKKLINNLREFIVSKGELNRWLGLNTYIKCIIIRLPYWINRELLSIYIKIHFNK